MLKQLKTVLRPELFKMDVASLKSQSRSTRQLDCRFCSKHETHRGSKIPPKSNSMAVVTVQ